MPNSYMNHSKSRYVKEAESEGRLPLSRAVIVISEEASISKKEAKSLLEDSGASEWHYTGRGARKIKYYDTNMVLNNIKRF